MPDTAARKLQQLPIEQLMSQQAAAKALGIGRATVTAWIGAEKLEAGLDPYGVMKPTRESVERLAAARLAGVSAAA